MTPQEKTDELIRKYYRNSDLIDEDLTWIQAKQCALIAAVETKLQFMEIDNYDKAAYWRSVELELEKL